MKTLLSGLMALALLASSLPVFAADAKPADPKAAKAKPYTLKTCLVSDEKLGEMGEPYVFVHEGQEIKLCCKSCLKDFNKNQKKFMTKLADETKKAASAPKTDKK